VKKVQRLRAMGSLCRQQAAYNSMNKWKLLAEAEHWEHLAYLELSSYFQECNAVSSNEIPQPQALSDANDVRWETMADPATRWRREYSHARGFKRSVCTQRD
jgi:hypothetical protein